MKAVLTLILTVNYFAARKCQDCDDTGVDPQELAVKILKKNLFCNYDASVIPRINFGSSMDVAVTLRIKHIEHFQNWNANADEIRVNSWMVWNWTDENLKWNPKDNAQIDYIVVNSDAVWRPYLFHLTASDADTLLYEIAGSKCTVFSSGKVICSHPATHQALCTQDLSNWPFDTQKCSIQFVFVPDSEIYYVNISKSECILDEYEKNNEWELLSIETLPPSEHAAPLEYVLEIRRHASGYVASTCIPAIVLTLSTLLIFWIDSMSSCRIYLCCMNIFMYLLYMIYIVDSLPSAGEKCPKIVFFFRDSMLLSGIALALSVILRNASSLQTLPPFWVVYTFKVLQDKKIGQIIFFPNSLSKETTMNQENGGEITLSASASEWRIVVYLVDRLCFYLYVLIFLSLFLVLVY